MATVNAQARRRPGPKPAGPSKEPSGYRISERRRLELRMAMSFTGRESLQDVIDLAVTQFLDRMHARTGFQDAVTNAEASIQEEHGIPQIRPDGPESSGEDLSECGAGAPGEVDPSDGGSE